MSRFEEAELALVEKLRALDLSPDMTVNMFNIEDPLNAVGFSQDEIMAVLQALEQDRILEFVPGNRLRQLRSRSSVLFGAAIYWKFSSPARGRTLKCPFKEDSDEYDFELSVTRKWWQMAQRAAGRSRLAHERDEFAALPR
jgi:hypothetical protein